MEVAGLAGRGDRWWVAANYERESRAEREKKLTVTSSFTESRISLFIFWADSINCIVGKDDIIITSLLQLHTAKR